MKYFLAIFLFSLTSFASENQYTGSILFIKGNAHIAASAGYFGPAKKGELLSAGDEIKTGEKSLVIIRFPDKSTMRVEPKSHVKFDSIVERVQGKSLGSTSLILKAGRSVINVINKSKAPIFKVRTKSVAVGVRGTRFYTGIDEDNDNLDIAVQSGEVEVQNTKNSNMADAVEAGQGLTIEKGENFTQPQNYDWVNKVNYNADDKTVDPNYLGSLLASKRLEFRQKRKAWKRNKEKWLKKKSLWKNRKSSYLKNTSALKNKRKSFLKNKKNFLKKKKNYDLKRNNIFKSRRGLRKNVLDLKRDRSQWKKDLADYRKGKKDPRKAAALLKRKQKLDLRRTDIKSGLKNQKIKRLSLNKEHKNLIKNIPVNDLVKKEIKKKKQEVKKKAKKKVKRKARKEVKKKLKGLLGF